MLISKDYKIFIAGHKGMVGSAIKRVLIRGTVIYYAQVEKI